MRHPQRRRGDHRWKINSRENWYRDVLLVVVCGLVVLSLNASGDALDRVQQGRIAGTKVTCAIASAISEAGRQTIEAQPFGESPFIRFLERHGYPPASVRERQSQAAAAAYVSGISQRVERQIGHKSDGLINRDGTINCARLAAIAAVPRKPR